MKTKLQPADLRRIAGKAVEGGYGFPQTPGRCLITACGNCENPLTVEFWSRPEPTHGRKDVNVPEDGYPYGLDIVARCRRCDSCKAYRIDHWKDRAQIEYERSSRVWFGTLTLRPEWHNRLRIDNGLVDWQERRKATVRELQLYFKRLRKACAAPHAFRYLYVIEKHKSGLPHVHVLIFERTLGTITKEMLERWKQGFVYWRLARDIRSATAYCLKYTLKGDERLRASLQFGKIELSELSTVSVTSEETYDLNHQPELDLLNIKDGLSH